MAPKRRKVGVSAKNNEETVEHSSSSNDAHPPPSKEEKPQPKSTMSNKEATAPAQASAEAEGSTSGGLVRFVAVAFVAVVMALTILNTGVGGGGGSGLGSASPCGCAAAGVESATPGSAQHRVASNLLTRRASGVSGVHAHTAGGVRSVKEVLQFADRCGVVKTLSGRIATVETLHKALAAPFKKARCVVWVAEEDTVQPVAGALKELLEDNALRGTPVVPPGARGMLVLVSAKSREELKNVMPHRVVHMFSTVEMP